MRAGSALLLLFCACPPPLPPAPPASRFNGVWASGRDDAGLREGVLIHDLHDGGVVWSPRRLVFNDGGLTITHRCSDFTVGTTGQVTAVVQVAAAGVVTEGSGGVAFVWTAGTQAMLVSSRLDVDEVRLGGELADGSISVRLDWLRGGALVESEVKQLGVSRQLECE